MSKSFHRADRGAEDVVRDAGERSSSPSIPTASIRADATVLDKVASINDELAEKLDAMFSVDGQASGSNEHFGHFSFDASFAAPFGLQRQFGAEKGLVETTSSQSEAALSAQGDEKVSLPVSLSSEKTLAPDEPAAAAAAEEPGPLQVFGLKITFTGPEIGEMRYGSSSWLQIGTISYASSQGTPTYTFWNGSEGHFAVIGNVLYATDYNYFNYEARQSVTIYLRATDSTATAQTNATVAISNIYEGATNITLSNGSVAENSPASTPIGTLDGFNPEANSTLQWSLLTQSVAGAFSIDASGQVYVNDGSKLNYESTAPYTITARAYTVIDGVFVAVGDKTFTINLQDVNERPDAPVVQVGSTQIVQENLTSDVVVATVQAADPDNALTPRQTMTYSLLNTLGGRFEIDSATGRITAHAVAGFNFEADSTEDPYLTTDATGRYYKLQVTATDSGINPGPLTSGITTVNIYVQDVNEKPNAPTLEQPANNITEGIGQGSSVAKVKATDPDNARVQHQALKYELVNDLGGRFKIDPDNGMITIKANGLFDYEADPAADPYLQRGSGTRYYELFVRAKDDDPTNPLVSDALKVVVYMTDVNEKPFAPVVQSGSILHFSENPTTNKTVATVKSTDPDIYAIPAQTLTYFLVDNLGGRFSVDANGNVIALASGSFNFEADAASDPYLQKQTNGGITKRWYDVKVFAKDNGTGTLASDVTTIRIDLDDVNEKPFAPVVQSGSVLRLSENLTTNKIVATVKSTDADTYANPAQTLTYSLVSSLGGRFSVDANGNVIALASGSFNFEADSASDPYLQKLTTSSGTQRWYEVQVKATDNGSPNLTSDITIVRIDVDDVNEAPSIAFSQLPVTSILENPTPGDPIAQAKATDPDIFANQTLTYALADTLGGRFKVNPATGEIFVDQASLIDYESTNDPYLSAPDSLGRRYYTLKVVASDGSLSSSVLTFSFQVKDRAEAPNAPTIVNNFVAIINENAQGNPSVATMFAVDPDHGAQLIKYALVDSLGDRFTIDEFSGEITVRDGSLINNEAASSSDPYLHPRDDSGLRYYILEVTATDGGGLTNPAPTPVKVYIKDVNEAPTSVDVAALGSSIQAGVTHAGTEVFRATANDPDVYKQVYQENKFKFANGSLTDGIFQIDPDTGVIKVTQDVENAGAYTLSIVAYDRYDTNLSKQRDYTFTVLPHPNRAPSAPTLSNTTISERLGTGQAVGDLQANDADGDPVTFRFQDQDALADSGGLISRDQRFIIIGGKIKVYNKANIQVDHETPFTYAVVASDGRGGATVGNVTITVKDNLAPSAPTLSNSTISETVPTGQLVGNLNSTDGDNDAVTFKFQNAWAGSGGLISADERFIIVDGKIQVYKHDKVQVEQTTPFTYAVEASDGHGGATVGDVTITVTDNPNHAPGNIRITGNRVNEDAGVGQYFGTLWADELDVGDYVHHFNLDDDCGGLFSLYSAGGAWTIMVNGRLDYENDADPRLHSGFDDAGRPIKWYEIKVSATDSYGLSSASQTLQIIVVNVEPDNSAPEIRVDPNGHTSWAIGDTDTVAPFRDLTFFDAEDGVTLPPTPIVAGVDLNDITSGVLIVPDAAQFPDLEVTWDPINPYSVWVRGAQDKVTAFIKLVQFDPLNRPGDANTAAAVRISDFTVTVYDSSDASSIRHVTVAATATGRAANNVAPVIHVDPAHASTPTTDWAVNPAKPFEYVTLTDTEGDTLTVTISFNRLEGTLGGAGRSGDLDGDTVTYTFRGDAITLTQLLHGLTFDATNRDAPGPNITTRFTITVNDGHHGVPVTNTDVTVVTTVTGPLNVDNVYHVHDADMEIIELTDPSGGNDKAYIYIDHYSLSDTIGIETLEAAAGVDFDISLKGNVFANTIIGGAGNDTLEGGGVTGPVSATNRDVLRGGAGDDTYIVRDAGVVIEEFGGLGEGLDTVRLEGALFGTTITSYTLADNVEVLIAGAGTGAIELIGNSLGNIILGNAFANRLIGGDGNDSLNGGPGAADTLVGGNGDDLYSIHNANDVIVEGAGDTGIDTAEIYASAYTLGAGVHVEKLEASNFTLDGVTGIRLVGNEYSTTIAGGINADTLDGGTGVNIAHTLNGGAGNDVYYIVNAGDVIEGELDGNGNGSTFGTNDVAYLYRGLYADQQALDVAIAFYQSKGIEAVHVVGGLPPGMPNRAPTAPTLAVTEIFETFGTNAPVGGLQSRDDDGDPIGFQFKWNDNTYHDESQDHRFKIVSGQIAVADSNRIQVESDTPVSYVVLASDGRGGMTEGTISFTIRNVDQAPTISGLSTAAINADANSGTVSPFTGVMIANDAGQETVATITFQEVLGALIGAGTGVSDTTGTGLITYTVTGTNAADLQTKLAALTFDPRTLAAGVSEDIVLNVTVTDVNHTGAGTGQTGTVTVHSAADAPTNQAPVGLDWSGNWAREGSQNGFTIGSLLPVDPDGPSGSYSFKFVIGTDGDGNPILSDRDADGRFYIDGDRLKVFDGSKLDFETARSHVVKIQVSDGSGTFQKDMTITVRDWFNEFGTGTSANDTLKGGAGDDVFDGGAGNDVLKGGYGFNDLTGGAGNDAFVFDTDRISGEFDTIQDFAPGEDKIHLKADVFQLWGLEGGELTDDVFVIGAAATSETHRIIYDADTGTLYYDEDGSGAAEAMMIAILVNPPALNKSDFLVI